MKKLIFTFALILIIFSSLANAQRLHHNRPHFEMLFPEDAREKLLERRQRNKSATQRVDNGLDQITNRSDAAGDFFREESNSSNKINYKILPKSPTHNNQYRKERLKRDSDYLGANIKDND